MPLFSSPIELHRKEPVKSSAPKETRKAPPLHPQRPSPFTKEMKSDMNTAFKKMFAKEKKNQEAETAALSYFAALDQISSTGKAAPSASIDPSIQITQLFEKLVSTLTHMHQEGINKTTIELNSSGFASSVFYGATLTLTEYNTAPKLFNVHLTASPEGVALFEAHAGELAAALQKGNFGFGVHRLDTELQGERLERPLPDHHSEDKEEGESAQ